MNYDSLCKYLEAKPDSRRDMPFGADTLVFKVMGKIFALVAWQADPLTVNLKVDPVEALFLRKQYPAVMAGYHMNKKHWNTVTLDGSIPDAEIQRMIDDSYGLVVKGLSKAQQDRLRMMGWMDDEA
ncbi:MmcQ/YjbR family DNA-binding protein [Chloroflexota bacterium]|nr:MmcQ/YjbR family DNA-binding protein [Chloroflexota bacterium]